MKLYIDKSNLLSLLTANQDEKFSSVMKMVKTHLDIGFNFEKNAVRGDDIISKFFTQLTSGRKSGSPTFTANLIPNLKLKNNFLNFVYQKKRCFLLNRKSTRLNSSHMS